MKQQHIDFLFLELCEGDLNNLKCTKTGHIWTHSLSHYQWLC